jgi:hypothetical protein
MTSPNTRRTGGPAKRAAAKPAPEPEPEVEEPELDDDAESGEVDGRQWGRMTFLERPVRMFEPTGGQRFVLLQTIGITDESADVQEKLELALGFSTMIRALFVRPAERQFVTGALARGIAEIEDYFALAREMVEFWGIEDEAPANNREERRARERRPVAKVAGRRGPRR